MGDLIQHFLISFIGALDTEVVNVMMSILIIIIVFLQDAKVAELMTALAFCGRRLNKQVQGYCIG